MAYQVRDLLDSSRRNSDAVRIINLIRCQIGFRRSFDELGRIAQVAVGQWETAWSLVKDRNAEITSYDDVLALRSCDEDIREQLARALSIAMLDFPDSIGQVDRNAVTEIIARGYPSMLLERLPDDVWDRAIELSNNPVLSGSRALH